MGFGQVVASVARNALVTAAATVLLYSGANFVLNKQTPTGPTAGAPIQVWKTSSGGSVAMLDELGKLTLSGGLVVDGVAISTGASLNLAVGDARYVRKSGSTMTGALTVQATISGYRLVISGNANVTGALLVVGNILSRSTVSGSLLKGTTLSGNYVKTGQFSPSPSTVEVALFGSGAAVTTGSGKAMYVVPDTLSGAKISKMDVYVLTAGVTNATKVQVRVSTKGNCKVFSTPPQIDTATTNSVVSGTAQVVNTACNNLTGRDYWLFDIPNVSTTAPKVMNAVLYFYR